MAVPGRPPVLKESGEDDRLSVELDWVLMFEFIDSRLNRENIIFRFSKRGRMTVSRKAVRTILRTSSTCPAGS